MDTVHWCLFLVGSKARSFALPVNSAFLFPLTTEKYQSQLVRFLYLLSQMTTKHSSTTAQTNQDKGRRKFSRVFAHTRTILARKSILLTIKGRKP